MSPMTILATLAFAMPTNESGPVWSAMTPTLMLSVMVSSSFAERAVGHVQTPDRGTSDVGASSRRSASHTSGDHPIMAAPLRLAEFVATLALAQDNAFGQPLESQLRSCLLAALDV